MCNHLNLLNFRDFPKDSIYALRKLSPEGVRRYDHPRNGGRQADMPTPIESPRRWPETALAFTFGIVALAVVLWLAFRGNDLDDHQFQILRIVLALAGGGVGAVIPGFLEANLSAGSKAAIRSGGALAVFVVLYFWSPVPGAASKPSPREPVPPSIIEQVRVISDTAKLICDNGTKALAEHEEPQLKRDVQIELGSLVSRLAGVEGGSAITLSKKDISGLSLSAAKIAENPACRKELFLKMLEVLQITLSPKAQSQLDKRIVVIRAVDFTDATGVAPAGGETLSYGDVLINSPPYTPKPNSAEWIAHVEMDGDFQLAIEYASEDARPVDIYVNGKIWRRDVLAHTTGCFFLSCQRWEDIGTLQLHNGDNSITISRNNVFPHLRTLRFTPIE